MNEVSQLIVEANKAADAIERFVDAVQMLGQVDWSSASCGMQDDAKMQAALLIAAEEVRSMGEAVQCHIEEYIPLYEGL
jgi:hypothetical protein